MKGLKKTRRGAIALVFTLVLASGLALTGCDNGFGPNRGFDPVGTWRGTMTDIWHCPERGTQHWRSDLTMTFFANGTGTIRYDQFHNHQFRDTYVYNFNFSVSDIIMHIVGGDCVFRQT